MPSYKAFTKLYLYYKQKHFTSEVNYSFLLLWMNILIISMSKYLYDSLQLMNVGDLYLEDFVKDTIDIVIMEEDRNID